MIARAIIICWVFSSLFFAGEVHAQNQSKLLQVDEKGRLIYHSDTEGNHLPDFSHAGYKNGGVDIPDVPTVLAISSIEGDNTAHIQAAIDKVAAMPLDKNGIRGALLLKPGRYPVHGSLNIWASGVTLRGSGEMAKSKSLTVIKGVGNKPKLRNLINITAKGQSDWNDEVIGSRVDIVNEYIPAGSRTFEVADASKFKVGDNIIIKHPSTKEWIEAVNYGETAGGVLWKPGDLDMLFNRFITKIVGNKIKVDVPIYHELDRSLSQAFVFKTTRANLLTNVAIEKLRIDIETNGEPEDEEHVNNAIQFDGVEDCWVQNVNVRHFVHAGITLRTATRCTVRNSASIEPVSVITGGRRYNFDVSRMANNILFENCHATKARHAFVSNGTSKVSGIVFKNCSSSDDFTASESHRRWGQALLYDQTSHHSITTNRVLALYNRGDYGTGHGWTGTHQVAWNVRAPNNQIVIQKPPIGQNYCIGCIATVDNQGPFIHPEGWIESTGEHVEPASLYAAQLSERMTYGVGPDAPGKLQATIKADTVTLEWFDIALDETHYLLERSSDGGATFELVAKLAENTQSFTDTTHGQGSYNYRVKAVNAIGSSPWSNVVLIKHGKK